MNELRWQRKGRVGEIRLFRGKLIFGLLKQNAWASQGYGECAGHLFRFRTRGVWKPMTEIWSFEEPARLLGTIQMELWQAKAELIYEGQRYNFTLRPSGWELNGQEGSWLFTREKGDTWEGTVSRQGEIEDEVLMVGFLIKSKLSFYSPSGLL